MILTVFNIWLDQPWCGCCLNCMVSSSVCWWQAYPVVCAFCIDNELLRTHCDSLLRMLMPIQSNVAAALDTDETGTKKSQKDASTDKHSTDLFSVHNFDVTIDLAFPSGEWSVYTQWVSVWLVFSWVVFMCSLMVWVGWPVAFVTVCLSAVRFMLSA